MEAFRHSRNLQAIGLFLFTFFQAMALDFAKDSHNITNFLREQPNLVQLSCLTAGKLEVLAADAGPARGVVASHVASGEALFHSNKLPHWQPIL
jgi:hypothetical protein